MTCLVLTVGLRENVTLGAQPEPTCVFIHTDVTVVTSADITAAKGSCVQQELGLNPNPSPTPSGLQMQGSITL